MHPENAHKRRALLGALSLFFLILALAGVYHLYFRTDWTPAAYTETADALSNPYCGWYHLYGYQIADDRSYTPAEIQYSYQDDVDTRLALLEFNLQSYRNGTMSDAALQQVDTILSCWEQTHKTLLVRFVYDWDGHASDTEPQSLPIILEHMSQLSTIINRHTASIYMLQGIFIGNYGEMHGSAFAAPATAAQLLAHLAQVTDPSIFLSVRTPAQWRVLTDSANPIGEATAFSAALSARVGLFNDGMLGSESDCGTYAGSADDTASVWGQRVRTAELAFQNQLCRYVPNGGEVILPNAYNDLAPAIAALRQMHVSYLNSGYDPAVLDKWRASVYTGDDVFQGCSGYEYISCHLGYRYVLRSSALRFHTFWNKSAQLTIQLENVGFANSYKPFTVSVLLQNTQTNETKTLLIDTDTRDWLPTAPIQLTVPLDVRTYGVGKYTLSFCITDAQTNMPIALANADAAPAVGYPLGTLTVQKTPQK